ncbi:TetR/AcrR family transcriptional regulator [Kitasatospora sp. NPDC002227]|uniref:TetR/AcrR family transcriptional regulator n=1 Tax=Kitasatospora sp. NPDC002227 TaxID=3154773 RepID=UPI003330504C
MSTEVLGLRESKKLETRQLISDHATRLFIAQGFERTTIAEIAAAARVAKKTVTNYFPHKEDLALDHSEVFVQSLARAVAERAEGEGVVAALRREFVARTQGHDAVAGFAGPEFARMVAESPTLVARVRELYDLREAALVEALEAGAGPAAGIAPRAAAALIGAAHKLLFRRLQELTLAGESNERIAELLAPETAHVFDLLDAALGGYPAPPD